MFSSKTQIPKIVENHESRIFLRLKQLLYNAKICFSAATTQCFYRT